MQVFNQQTIELAIVAENQNSTVIIFTVVTIVFLPLAFLTSYFGMNLQGVVQTKHGEGFFWMICGSVAAGLGVVVVVVARFRMLIEGVRYLRRVIRDVRFAENGDGDNDGGEWRRRRRASGLDGLEYEMADRV